jgi:hypothetical protein
MRKIVIASIVLLMSLGTFWACRDDVFVEPPPSLSGEYEGFYSVKPAGQIAIEQPITWRFTDQSYNMWYRGDDPQNRSFCDCSGTYELTGNVELEETTPVVGQIICDPELNPKGTFQLNQSTDTITLTQSVDLGGVTTIRELRLARN